MAPPKRRGSRTLSFPMFHVAIFPLSPEARRHLLQAVRRPDALLQAPDERRGALSHVQGPESEQHATAQVRGMPSGCRIAEGGVDKRPWGGWVGKDAPRDSVFFTELFMHIDPIAQDSFYK